MGSHPRPDTAPVGGTKPAAPAIAGARPGMPFGPTGTLVAGGGNQDAFSPQAAHWQAPPPQNPRAQMAMLMAGNTPVSRNADRGYDHARGRESYGGYGGGSGGGWGMGSGIGGGMGGRSSGGLY